MAIYNINVQFPNHWLTSKVEVANEDFSNGLLTGLITTFTDPGDKEPLPELQPLFGLLAEFYGFGAKYFETGKVSGEDVAAKLNNQLGEIYLGQDNVPQSWHFTGVWPHSVNFGEMCYSSDPTVHLEVTWKYKKVTRHLNPIDAPPIV